MLNPSLGMAFVIEHVDDGLTDAARELGFISTEKKNMGCLGTVYAINDEHYKCEKCQHDHEPMNVKAGDEVIYSKFVAEYVFLRDEEGKEIKNLVVLPVEAILGTLS